MVLDTYSRINLLEDKIEVELSEYLKTYGNRISQDSEKLFLTEFLYPLLGKRGIKYVVPQYPFIDSEGRSRRIDFALIKDSVRIALEVNGETYHAEGIIPGDVFDDNLQRQNEILNAGWILQRFSFNQLQESTWRKRVMDTLHRVISKHIPELISEDAIKPNYLQTMALDALDFYRQKKGWKKGIIVLPTGTGKTFLSAFDAKKFNGRTLFLVHRLDILSQSKDAFEKVWPNAKTGLLTGEARENVHDSRVLFCSKDTLKSHESLNLFKPDEFDYIIIDEVHHGQAPSYHAIIKYFNPKFMLGMTATPDRMDRKDIFELFDYSKIFEYTLNEAIENGFLVPYTYYGLKDNIDYSKIRYNGQKYNVQDLDKHLIIEKRNQKILEEYLKKGNGNKAIGFCCSITHALRMADFFVANGIPAMAITSESVDREQKIQDFRDNKYAVAFTVDLFNEGIDFPDVRVLLFVRPTESKTVFMQQLGRGLRLCSGKDRVVILDFIGNYKKANKIRAYLSKKFSEQKDPKSGRVEKLVYEYDPKCQVIFDEEVEEILDGQDRYERGVSKEDLVDAYYKLAEKLERKPSQEDINHDGEFKISRYVSIYGSWIKFLREIGEFTEASYHYPQGVDLGHILYALKVIGEIKRQHTHLEDKYVKLRGEFDDGRLGAFQRQTKYKLQAMMEIGLVVDDRDYGPDEKYTLDLTPEGKKLYEILKPMIDGIDLSFSKGDGDVPSWDMKVDTQEFNRNIWGYIQRNATHRDHVRRLFLNFSSVSQMLNYLYRIERKKQISKADIYSGFFKAPFVKLYCDQNGIEVATDESAKHRCPFLLNILEAIGVLSQSRSDISLQRFLICKETMQLQPKENDVVISNRINAISKFLSNKPMKINAEDESLLKEAYGASFLNVKFYLPEYEILPMEKI